MVDIAALLLRNYFTVSAFYVLVWEYAITFDDEYHYIWRWVQVLWKALSDMQTAHQQETSQYDKNSLYYGEIHVVAGPRVLVAVLMIRDRSIAILLFSLFTLQCIVAAVSGYQTLRKITFDEICTALNTPYDVIYLGLWWMDRGMVVLSQSIIWTMTLSKRNIVPGGTPLIHLTLRDGGLTFALIASIVSMGIPYALHSETRVSEPHFVLIWPTSLVSITDYYQYAKMQT
ncbi:hypothetical protein BDQ17DRAFT_1327488 [Cyathus striatus]|nr:hypothetical protein BDQ17DRAFT_1327488 [Cyathus striatus]